MQRFKNILLVIGDTCASPVFERAVHLARSNQAQLALLSIVEWLERDIQLLVPAFSTEDLWELSVHEHREELERLAGTARQAELSIRTKVLRGTPFLTVIREVLREGIDLVVMAGEKTGSLSETIMGSTSMHLMRKCPCPVWIVNPDQRHRYARVLAAVDPTSPGDVHADLNNTILELASSLARGEGSELHIVNCWISVAKRLPFLTNQLPSGQIEEVTRRTKEAHEKAFGELVRRFTFDDLRVQAHLLEGGPGDVLVGYAHKKHVDVIVMGTVCRTGIAGFFIGNTAEEVLHRVKCSVLTVKPRGFVTPVRLEDQGDGAGS